MNEILKTHEAPDINSEQSELGRLVGEVSLSLDDIKQQETSSLLGGVMDSTLGKIGAVFGITTGASKLMDSNPSMGRRGFLKLATTGAVVGAAAMTLSNSAEANESMQPPLPSHITKLIDEAQSRRADTFAYIGAFDKQEDTEKRGIMAVLGNVVEDYEKVQSEYQKLVDTQGFPQWDDHNSLRYVRPDFASTLKALANMQNSFALEKNTVQKEKAAMGDLDKVEPDNELYAMQELQLKAAENYLKAWLINKDKEGNFESIFRFGTMATLTPVVARSLKNIETAGRCFTAVYQTLTSDAEVIMPAGEIREKMIKECQYGVWRVNNVEKKRAKIIVEGEARNTASADLYCNGLGEICLKKGVIGAYRDEITTETFPTYIIGKIKPNAPLEEFDKLVAKLAPEVFKYEDRYETTQVRVDTVNARKG